MAIELFPLLKRLQVGAYDNCVVLTYTADLCFFEQVVLPTLRSRGCCNNLVLMDSRQYAVALDTTGTMLQRLGKSYSVWPVSASRAFHPKLILQTNDKGGRLIIGSGNLTVRGFSANWEVFSEVEHTADSGNGGMITGAWQLIKEASQGANKAVLRQLEQIEETSGSVLSSGQDRNWPRLLTSTPSQPSLLIQLKSLLGSGSIKRVIVVAPFFDPQLRAIREFQKTFKAKEVIVVVQPASVSFPGRATVAKSLTVYRFEPPHDDKSETAYLHAKAYIIQTATGEYCVWGSPNCSMAALAGQGNYEAVLVTKGKVGEGIAALGLSESIKKGRRIDPASLGLASENPSRAKNELCIKSAEVDRGEMYVVIAPIARFSDSKDGRLRLWSRGIEIGTIQVKRTGATTFVGRLSRGETNASVICRLLLHDKMGEQESTAAAVHFLADLAEATPTRLQARMQRLVEAIRSGTLDWAKGLENVCELVIKIGLQESNESPSQTGGVRTSGERPRSSQPEAEETVEDYEYFLEDERGQEDDTKGGHNSSLLEDIVATLRKQILFGVTTEDGDEATGDLDTWRYREEVEREAAESGASETESDLPDSEISEREHKRIRRAYVRLMRGLSRRYEWLRDQGKTIRPEEFWRLDAVNLLLLDGCGRVLEQAVDCGPVVTPEDIMHNYLPAVAVFLGRVRVLRDHKEGSGPLLDWAQADCSDARIVNTARSTCAVLAGLAAHWRQQMRHARDEDALDEWPHYAEIVAVRCLAAFLRQTLLPKPHEFSEAASKSAWLVGIGCSTLGKVFDDLCRGARTTIRFEDQFAVEQGSRLSQDIREGDWVCTAISGVTEVVEISSRKVTIAMIGQPDTDEDWYRKVRSDHIQPVNIPSRRPPKPLSVVDELDYLLPYTDQDFEESRDVIIPQLKRAYSTALLKASQHARSLQLRSEASRLLGENLVLPSPCLTSDSHVAASEKGQRPPVDAILPERFLTCTDVGASFKDNRKAIRKLND